MTTIFEPRAPIVTRPPKRGPSPGRIFIAMLLVLAAIGVCYEVGHSGRRSDAPFVIPGIRPRVPIVAETPPPASVATKTVPTPSVTASPKASTATVASAEPKASMAVGANPIPDCSGATIPTYSKSYQINSGPAPFNDTGFVRSSTSTFDCTNVYLQIWPVKMDAYGNTNGLAYDYIIERDDLAPPQGPFASDAFSFDQAGDPALSSTAQDISWLYHIGVVPRELYVEAVYDSHTYIFAYSKFGNVLKFSSGWRVYQVTVSGYDTRRAPDPTKEYTSGS